MEKFFSNILKKVNLTPQKFVIIISLIVFLPLIAVSFFDHPSVDDFCYSTAVQDIGFMAAQIKSYVTWTGRYTATAAISIITNFPSWMNEYKFIPIGLLLFTFLSLFLLLKIALKPLYGTKAVSNITAVNLSLVTMILLITSIPSATEGIYWASGAITYQGSFIFLILGCTLAILLFRKQSIVKILYTILLIIVTILLVGFNEIAMMISVLFSGLFFIYTIKSKENRLQALLIFITSLACAYFVIKAPGNSIRSAQYQPEKISLNASIYQGTIMTFQTMLDVMRSTNFWLLSLMFILFLPRVNEAKIKKCWIWLTAILTPMIVGMGAMAPFVVAGYLPLRTVDLLTEIFVIGFLLTVSLLFFSRPKLFSWRDKLSTNAISMFLICSFLGVNIILGRTAVGLAYSDLITGHASNYDQQLKARYAQIAETQKNPIKVLQTNALQNLPKLIYFDDIKPDKTDWRNLCYADYFKIPGIETGEHPL